MTTMVHRREFWVEWLCAIPLALVLGGSGLLFGGVAWWFRPLAVLGVSLAVSLGLVRIGCLRGKLFLRSPLVFIAVFACLWALAQMVPLPKSLVRQFAPMSEQVYSLGLSPASLAANLPVDDETSTAEPVVASSRIPISLDRSAGFRRLVTIVLAVGIFWCVGTWTDRLPKLHFVLGLVIVTGMINSAILSLQFVDGSTGLYGFFRPNQRSFIGPGWVDLKASPAFLTVQPALAAASNAGSGSTSEEGQWILQKDAQAGLVGTLPGGFLSNSCLQALAMPAMFGCLCYLAQRRGSRFTVIDRLRDRGVLTLWAVLAVSLAIGAFMIGTGGVLPALAPTAIGVFAAAFFALRADVEKWIVAGLFTLFAAGMAGGMLNADYHGAFADQGVESIWTDSNTFKAFASDNLKIWKLSGWTGIGLGAYSSVAPYVKQTFVSPTSAVSSLLGLLIELGLPLVVMLTICGLWVCWRFFTGLKGVDAEHRCLLGAIIGACAGAVTGMIIMPGWELPALTLMAASVCGLADRCLCGASDLFVESWEGV